MKNPWRPHNPAKAFPRIFKDVVNSYLVDGMKDPDAVWYQDPLTAWKLTRKEIRRKLRNLARRIRRLEARK